VPNYNNIVSRADAAPLIPQDVVTDVIKQAAAESAAMSLFRQVNMGSKTTSLPVLSALAQAYFVNGDTGLKETTEQAWNGITLRSRGDCRDRAGARGGRRRRRL
jgi:HK97 family phage major capsid protein